ncbi:MAG TPA: hypothetical protein VHX16_12560 [Chloroflexota bacterium]|jgi:hypothetical protein|nr:hypothetical protein [Chloroflexota bacterium]
MTAPDRQVADRILEALRAAEVLSDDTLARISQRLADGTITSDDWVHELERDLTEHAG